MDRERIEWFLDHFIDLTAGATTIALLAVAERSGLVHYMAGAPPQTSTEIAKASGLNERYLQEILSGLAAVSVVEYDPAEERFHLPPEHALFLADESSPYFMGFWFDLLPAAVTHLDGIAAAVREGGGVAFEQFGEDMIRVIERSNSPSFRVFLTKRWLPAVPGLRADLERGIRVADAGCGSGTAALLMATAYPNSVVFGYDSSEESITRARSRAQGLANLEFETRPVEDLPTDPGFDLITAFDVIHDLADPLAGLTRIREALREGGRFLMMEPNMEPELEDNLTSRGAMVYGVSVLHCLTQSLAQGGAGLGAAWGPVKAEEVARRAGFESFERLDEITNRFSAFYLLS